MKIYFYPIILLFVLTTCVSLFSQQSFERTFPDYFYHNPLHANFMGDSILVVGDYGKSSCGGKYISLLDEKGYPIWDSTPITGSTGAFTHSLIHNDTIYAIGFVDLGLLVDGCSLSPALYSFEKDGTLIDRFVIDTTLRVEMGIGQGVGFYRGSDQLRFVRINDRIYFTFENGIFSLKTNFSEPQATLFTELSDFLDLLHLPDGRFVALSQMGLHFFNENLELIESIDVESTFAGIEIGNEIDYFNGHIIINEPQSFIAVKLADMSVHRINNLSTFNHQITATADTLYIYGDFQLLGGVSELVRMDTTFTIIENNDFQNANGPDLHFNDMIVQGDQMVFLGHQRVERFTQSREELHGGFVWSTQDFTFLDNRNVAISNLQILSPLQLERTYYIETEPNDSLLFYEFKFDDVRFQFDISNIGTEKIDTLAMASHSYIRSWGCDIRKRKTYTDLDLAPNETITLMEEYSFPGQISTGDVNLDIFVFHPEHKFDHDIDNNIISNVNIFTNTSDIIIPPTAIDCYPNPTKNAMTVQFSDDLKLQQWELYHVDGKLIRTEEVKNSSFQLTRNGLAAGVYFLKLQGERGSAVKQIVFKD